MNADNTNRDQQTRKCYIDLAKQHDIDIRWRSFCISFGARTDMWRRCFHFTGSLELAWHNNLYRAYNMPPSTAAQQASRQHSSRTLSCLVKRPLTTFTAKTRRPAILGIQIIQRQLRRATVKRRLIGDQEDKLGFRR
jgi:hypothetical protein